MATINLEGQENKRARIYCSDGFFYNGIIKSANAELLVLIDKFGNEIIVDAQTINRADVQPQ